MGIITISTVALSILFILISLHSNSYLDAQSFRSNKPINHSVSLALWFAITYFIILVLNALPLHIFNDVYYYNNRFISMCLWYGALYIALRFYLFDKWLNLQRGLHPNYMPEVLNENSSVTDHLKIKPLSFLRLVVLFFTTFFWFSSVIKYYEEFYPNLNFNTGLIVTCCIGVAGLIMLVRNGQLK